MSVVIVTGSCGLVGSECVRYFSRLGYDVVGIDNDMRAEFFGEDASTVWQLSLLKKEVPGYIHYSFDLRWRDNLDILFSKFGSDIDVIVHAAAQPSHDWAAKDPLTDFTVNALATMNVLEAVREHCPNAVVIYTSTNKVYGDTPNRLPLIENKNRWTIDPSSTYYPNGIREDMSVDQSTHSLFGVSKLAADVMVQEYGRYFGMKTGVFRGGCLTGGNHSGTQLHGFLSYLMKCAYTKSKYTVFGYKGKQVRDNIHSQDLVSAFHEFIKNPKPGAVYNIGGGTFSNCSMLEAIELCEQITERKFKYDYSDDNRIGDHIWWVTDTGKFKKDYPNWTQMWDIPMILSDIHESLLSTQ